MSTRWSNNKSTVYGLTYVQGRGFNVKIRGAFHVNPDPWNCAMSNTPESTYVAITEASDSGGHLCNFNFLQFL